MPPNEQQQQIYVAIWSKAVDTQMHFNEMAVKSRQFGLGFVAAALGLGIVMLSRGEEFAIRIPLFGGFDLHATVLIVAASAFGLRAVSTLDLNVYHKMLRGAVTFGMDFEEHYMKQIFDLEMGMTQAITHFSRHQDATVRMDGTRLKYDGQSKVNALEKIKAFYRTSFLTLFGAAVLLFVITAHFGHSDKTSAVNGYDYAAGIKTHAQ